jgi:hypothetical protein
MILRKKVYLLALQDLIQPKIQIGLTDQTKVLKGNYMLGKIAVWCPCHHLKLKEISNI